jgi:hypothetical protein
LERNLLTQKDGDMARLRKYKLVWAASDTEDIVGYKLYWNHGPAVDYECDAIEVGNVTEIAIPEWVYLSDGSVMFGITALDAEGNESDMTTLSEPFRLRAPQPPRNLCLEPVDEFVCSEAPDHEVIEPEAIRCLIEQLEDDTPLDLDIPHYTGPHEEGETPARFDIGSLF